MKVLHMTGSYSPKYFAQKYVYPKQSIYFKEIGCYYREAFKKLACAICMNTV